jgi:hypothetical protein
METHEICITAGMQTHVPEKKIFATISLYKGDLSHS